MFVGLAFTGPATKQSEGQRKRRGFVNSYKLLQVSDEDAVSKTGKKDVVVNETDCSSNLLA